MDTGRSFRRTGAISMTMAPDSYAGVTFKNADGGRVVMVSWMADWGTIQNAPTDGWNGTYTLCYDLSLRTTEDGIRLFQEPVKEYETLRGEPLIDETDIVIEGKRREYPERVPQRPV